MSLRPLAAECHDTEACPFQILTRFTQPHRLCSWSQSEIYQNLDSNSAATLGPRAQVNYASYWDFADRSCLSSKFCSLTKKWCRTFWGFCSTNFSIFSQNRCAILLENFKIGLAKIPQNVLHHSFCQTTKFLAEKTSGQLNIVATQQNLIVEVMF